MKYCYLIISIILFTFTNGYSQDISQLGGVDIATVKADDLSEMQVFQLKEKIEDQGLSVSEFATMAKLKGASSGEVNKIVQRLGTVRKPSDSKTVGEKDNVGSNPIDLELSEKAIDPDNSDKEKSIFGYNLFNTEGLTFAPNDNAPVSEEYVVGTDDVVSINVWGESETTYNLVVGVDGSIFIPNAGSVVAKGYSFRDVKRRVHNQLSTIYSDLLSENPSTFVDVAVTTGRSITVNVIGDALVPGTYQLSASASLFNALYLSGGPGQNGSFRNIQVIRDNKLYKTADIYQYLLQGDLSQNFQLMANDMIFIPPYTAHVEFSGEVKRPAIYEMLGGESLSDLIEMAGGYTPEAYQKNLLVYRTTDVEKEIKSVKHDMFKSFTLQNGDRIIVSPLVERFVNRVTIEGAVFKSGEFELEEGLTLSKLIEMAEGVREDAFMHRVVVNRLQDDNRISTVNLVLSDVLSGVDDLELQREDVVVVSSIFDLEESKNISILGEVQYPETYLFKENSSIYDLIIEAGGFSKMADVNVIEVVRRLNYKEAVTPGSKLFDTFKFKVNKELNNTPELKEFKLNPYDVVYVRRAPRYQSRSEVLVSGEVLYPGNYTIVDEDFRVSDLIEKSGGITSYAYIDGAYLVRTVNLTKEEKIERERLMETDSTLNIFVESFERIAINVREVIEDRASLDNLKLLNGDRLVIPVEDNTVKISGAVMNPVKLAYQDGMKLNKYIMQSGGFSNRAQKRRSYVIYPNGVTASTKSFLGFRSYPKIKPGSEIMIAEKPKRENQTQMWLSIGTASASLALSVVTIVNLTN